MNKKFTLFFICALIANAALAQERYSMPVNHIFDKDSLKGFDEELAKQVAFNDGFFGEEFKVYMYRAKRNFISAKYNVKPTQESVYKGSNPNILSASCVNEDFESTAAGPITTTGGIAGWFCTGSTNTSAGGSCPLPGCCVSAPSAIMVLSNGYTDATIGSQYPLYSVFGSSTNTGNTVSLNSPLGQMYGNSFIRINDQTPNFSVNQVSKSFAVTPANNIFYFAFASVFYSGHPCCDAGAFKLKLTNATAGTVIATPSFSYSGLQTTCTPTASFNYYNVGTTTPASTSSSIMYNPWQIAAIDLSPYIGLNIQLDFQACDCTGGAHYGYSYLDAQCSSFNFMVNSTPYPAGSSVNTCSSGSVNISAPSYFAPYSWTGPGGFTSTSQNISPTLSGSYTVTMGSPGLITSNVINLNISAAPSVSLATSNPLVCLGQTATLTVTGLTTFTWNTGATTNNIVITPTSSAIYSVNGADANGCPGGNSIFQGVSTCTGLQSLNVINSINVYPNPNNGEFTLKMEGVSNSSELIIENTLGQVVHSQTLNLGENKIRTKNLAQGIYYYVVLENKQVVSKGKMKIE